MQVKYSYSYDEAVAIIRDFLLEEGNAPEDVVIEIRQRNEYGTASVYEPLRGTLSTAGTNDTLNSMVDDIVRPITGGSVTTGTQAAGYATPSDFRATVDSMALTRTPRGFSGLNSGTV